MLRALESHRPAAVVIAVFDEQTAGVVSEIARRYPALALLVFGEHAPKATGRRSGPTLALGSEDHSSVERFFRDDVLGAARGSLHGVALSSVVQVLSIERRTCALRVRAGRRTGSMVVRNGAVVHAEYAGMSPIDAALQIFAWGDTDVSFEPAPVSIEQTIDWPLDYMLLESARRRDEHGVRAEPAARRDSVPPMEATARGSGDAGTAVGSEHCARLVDEVMLISGTLVAELIDVQRRTIVCQRAREGDRTVSPALVANVAESVFDMVREMERSDWVEDVVIRFSSCFKLLRPLPTSDNLVVCALFDSKQVTVGLASARLAHVVSALYAPAL
ncbi:MAG: DUF4388 domain-containing protein [Myxococcales bacterium]|nr:DUF4388 domain-containing protein [Myxococcales bacterium]